jgi:hypothetical protein
MRELQDEDNYRVWTAEEIARAQLTDPPSPCSYTSPAGAYTLELHTRNIHQIDSEFNFDLPRLPQDWN